MATLSNSLRQGGLVTRTGGEGDRRTASLDLTPAGETAVLRWKTLNERLLGLALRELPPDTRVTLVDALPALAEVYTALVTGTRDYVAKNGFRSAVIALSIWGSRSLAWAETTSGVDPPKVRAIWTA